MQKDLVFSLLNDRIEPRLLAVEVASSFQIPSLQIIGLPGPEVSEARDRIRAAFEAACLEFPRRRVVVNLAPASIRKSGAGLDLAMALGVWSAHESAGGSARKILAWAELSLDGSLKSATQPVRAIWAAWKNRMDEIILAEEDRAQALEAFHLLRQGKEQIFENVPPPRLTFAQSLGECVLKLQNPVQDLEVDIKARISGNARGMENPILLPISATHLRLSMISAIGPHHLLLIGPRGSGKSHLLEWRAALEPKPSIERRIQQRLLKELVVSRDSRESPNSAGDSDGAIIRRVSVLTRPAALSGSLTSNRIIPGELTLASGGLLLADEFPEWARDSRELLREPLERKKITLTRAHGSIEFPADFTWIGTANFCPCGGNLHGLSQSSSKAPPCQCVPAARQNYLNRLSGPILDRIDLIATVTSAAGGEGLGVKNLSAVQDAVAKAQWFSRTHWGEIPQNISQTELEERLRLLAGGNGEIRQIVETADSLRSRHKLTRVALSLAALDEKKNPEFQHFLEAQVYRAKPFMEMPFHQGTVY